MWNEFVRHGAASLCRSLRTSLGNFKLSSILRKEQNTRSDVGRDGWELMGDHPRSNQVPPRLQGAGIAEKNIFLHFQNAWHSNSILMLLLKGNI